MSQVDQETPYFPPESYCVSKEDEYDWYDRNAVYERKGSTKGNSSNNSNPTSSTSNSFSKRYSINLKSKASIIGLPKPQKTCYLDRKSCNNKHPSNVRFFPKQRSRSANNNVPLTEPSSPKVSCIGRVRSKRDRSRRVRLHHRTKENNSTIPPLKRNNNKEKKLGLWRSFKDALHLGRGRQTAAVDDQETVVKPLTVVKSEKCNVYVDESVTMSESTGLGGMKRFVSGRRSDSFGGCGLDFDETPRGESSVLSRRGVGPVMEVKCSREWECVGPASV
ncbi:hypothetical protein IFM89_031402 [Coptis chinensis]|uniref:Uncharacterized protein n=1 Tax=Coptis chinensis TaxID=261450 RepID=A0A835LPD4_9MAGN|nr:hypothetical protein IFM89_031402 [Coptis chinensis]